MLQKFNRTKIYFRFSLGKTTTIVQMAFSSVDPYSHARPDSAKVVHIHLDLLVDFDKTVLYGKAILFIQKLDDQHDSTECTNYKIILDIYEFDEDENKISITDYLTGENLEYTITKHVDNVGSKLTIRIPWKYYFNFDKYEYRSNLYKFAYNYKIEILYETRKDSLALYWLRSDQTSDGTHPFLITNNKFTYTRGIFPCQDSPSVRFTYTAEISVPHDFTVIMCGIKSNNIINVENRCKHIFYETNPMPSHAVIIIVGSLKAALLNSKEKITLWAERKYIERSKTVFINIETTLKIAKNICGPRFRREYIICVLPSNIPEIELQCYSMIFVSSTLLYEDPSYIHSTIARKVAQSWTGGLVTCVNFQHLWLIKSFSTLISKEIIRCTCLYKNMIPYEIAFLDRKIFNDFKIKIRLHGIDSQQRLIPDLRGILPKDITKYVPDEIGYFLLNCLQNRLGGSIIFVQYLKRFINNFCFKSINTDDWINHLYSYFDDKHEIIGNVLDVWLYRVNLKHINPPVESHCYLLAEQWITTETFNKFPLLLNKLQLFNVLQRMEFLSCLYALSTVLPIEKLKWLHRSLPLHAQTCENRLLLLRLYIRNTWLEMVRPALEFAREYCASTFACPIFRELYELKETRHLAISGFIAIVEKKCNMLPQTMEEVASILKINLKDIYTLTSEESTLHVRTEQ